MLLYAIDSKFISKTVLSMHLILLQAYLEPISENQYKFLK